MGTNKVNRGAVAETVAANVRAVRERRGMSQAQLAGRLTELGRPVQASAIAKVEAGDRRVDVDDLVAFAVALNVSLARLVVPDVDATEPVALVPSREVPASVAWRWATGVHHLAGEQDDFNDPDVQQRERDFARERPLWRAIKDETPLMLALRRLGWAIDRALDYRPLTGAPNAVQRQGVKSYGGIARVSMRTISDELTVLESGEE